MNKTESIELLYNVALAISRSAGSMRRKVNDCKSVELDDIARYWEKEIEDTNIMYHKILELVDIIVENKEWGG